MLGFHCRHSVQICRFIWFSSFGVIRSLLFLRCAVGSWLQCLVYKHAVMNYTPPLRSLFLKFPSRKDFSLPTFLPLTFCLTPLNCFVIRHQVLFDTKAWRFVHKPTGLQWWSEFWTCFLCVLWNDLGSLIFGSGLLVLSVGILSIFSSSLSAGRFLSHPQVVSLMSCFRKLPGWALSGAPWDLPMGDAGKRLDGPRRVRVWSHPHLAPSNGFLPRSAIPEPRSPELASLAHYCSQLCGHSGGHLSWSLFVQIPCKPIPY